MKNSVFDKYAAYYDEWFVRHRIIYKTELKTLKKIVPRKGKGIEIGVGTGRFAAPLGIKTGVDVSEKVLEKAKKRGIETVLASGEKLPFEKKTFDFALLMMTICFVKNPTKVIKETKRILRDAGRIIVAIIDRESFLGRLYKKKKGSPFYEYATFFSTEEILNMLASQGFGKFEITQSLFGNPYKLKKTDNVERGFGRGSFVVVSAGAF